jgi:hypothetical protein
VRVGVSGASPQLTAAGVHPSQPPSDVAAVSMPSEQAVETAVANGSLDSGVAVLPGQMRLGSLLVPVVDPGTTHTRIQHGDKGKVPAGPGVRRIRRRRDLQRPLRGTRARARDDPATVAITTQSVGHGGKVSLNFFAPNNAVVFLFIGSGLGMCSILMERAGGTVSRITAAPLRPTQIVLGKLF